jgi:hypothetical protein
MPNELTRLSPHIDEMRTSLTQTTNNERTLVQALSEELMRFDQETLKGIRTVAAEHEARRSGIFNELQALASSIGEFRSPQEAVPPPRVVRAEPIAASEQIHFEANTVTSAPGDWRQAITNLDIKDDLANLQLYMTGRDPRFS